MSVAYHLATGRIRFWPEKLFELVEDSRPVDATTPPRDWSGFNGCGVRGLLWLVPQTPFGFCVDLACLFHDWDYQSAQELGGNWTGRMEADRRFRVATGIILEWSIDNALLPGAILRDRWRLRLVQSVAKLFRVLPTMGSIFVFFITWAYWGRVRIWGRLAYNYAPFEAPEAWSGLLWMVWREPPWAFIKLLGKTILDTRELLGLFIPKRSRLT